MTVDASNRSGSIQLVANGDENSSIALRQRGLQWLWPGGVEDVIELLGRARALNPDDPQPQLNLGIALQGAQRHAEALEHFGQVQKLLPNDPTPFLYAATSLLALGRAAAALEAASDACTRAPQLPHALYAYGQTLLALNKPERAEQAFAAALRNAPTWAEAWIHCGVARYRQGEIEGAKTAMRQALHHAPGHAAASVNLDALLRISGEAQANASTAEARTNPVSDREVAGDNVILCAWKPKSQASSFGLAVEFLRRKPAFAKLQFGEWSQVLISQVNRGHFFFVIDQHRRIQGFLGWALTHKHLAEQWFEGRSGLRNEECREGDCVILNAWAAETHRANRFILDTVRRLFAGKRTIYFKRQYPDGRARPMRLSVNSFVTDHLADRPRIG